MPTLGGIGIGIVVVCLVIVALVVVLYVIYLRKKPVGGAAATPGTVIWHGGEPQDRRSLPLLGEHDDTKIAVEESCGRTSPAEQSPDSRAP